MYLALWAKWRINWLKFMSISVQSFLSQTFCFQYCVPLQEVLFKSYFWMHILMQTASLSMAFVQGWFQNQLVFGLPELTTNRVSHIPKSVCESQCFKSAVIVSNCVLRTDCTDSGWTPQLFLGVLFIFSSVDASVNFPAFFCCFMTYC